MPTTGITSVPTTERVISSRSSTQVDFLADNSFRSRMWILLIILLVLVASSVVYPAWAQEPAQSSTVKTRTERDLLREKEVPAKCVLWSADGAGAGEFSALGHSHQPLSRIY
jgi:hypothetical protein